MARLFIISINYAPEPTGFAPHAAALAAHLAGRGHDVSVFTGFPFAPDWRRRRGRPRPAVQGGAQRRRHRLPAHPFHSAPAVERRPAHPDGGHVQPLRAARGDRRRVPRRPAGCAALHRRAARAGDAHANHRGAVRPPVFRERQRPRRPRGARRRDRRAVLCTACSIPSSSPLTAAPPAPACCAARSRTRWSSTDIPAIAFA